MFAQCILPKQCKKHNKLTTIILIALCFSQLHPVLLTESSFPVLPVLPVILQLSVISSFPFTRTQIEWSQVPMYCLFTPIQPLKWFLPISCTNRLRNNDVKHQCSYQIHQIQLQTLKPTVYPIQFEVERRTNIDSYRSWWNAWQQEQSGRWLSTAAMEKITRSSCRVSCRGSFFFCFLDFCFFFVFWKF